VADGFNVNTAAEPKSIIKARLGPRTRKVFYGLAAILIVVWIFGDAPIYIATPSSGKIVDASTGKPLQGAVVVAEWILLSEGFGHASHDIRMKTIEAISDNEGKYEIGGWGPLPRAPFRRLDGLDPQITVFKPGYYPVLLVNGFAPGADPSQGLVRKSNFDGQSILLRPFDGQWEKYSWSLVIVRPRISGCMETCPRLVRAIVKEGERIEREAPKESTPYSIIRIDDLPQDMRRELEEIDAHEKD
jgi:hypothetical protein